MKIVLVNGQLGPVVVVVSVVVVKVFPSVFRESKFINLGGL
jgi:hypothetical protein